MTKQLTELLAEYEKRIKALEGRSSAGAGPTGPPGRDGKSAYDLYVEHNPGATFTQFITSLTGATGPQGGQGAQGLQGTPGIGTQGDPGPQGPAGPANKLTVGAVATLPTGSEAKVEITGQAPNQQISFSIPEGKTGKGEQGVQGNQGLPGVNAFTILKSNFVQPALFTSVSITVDENRWMAIGQPIYIFNAGTGSRGGYYRVAGKTGTTVVYIARFDSSGMNEGSTILAGGAVVPSGETGPVGPVGPAGRDGDGSLPAGIITVSGSVSPGNGDLLMYIGGQWKVVSTLYTDHDPTPTEIPTGTFRFVKNSTNAFRRLYWNIDGQIVSITFS